MTALQIFGFGFMALFVVPLLLMFGMAVLTWFYQALDRTGLPQLITRERNRYRARWGLPPIK